MYSKECKFRPVHHDDVTRAVAHAMEHPIHDQLKVRGEEKISIKDLLRMVEQSCDKAPGSTKTFTRIAFLQLSETIEEFFVGITHDRNMRLMLEHFETHAMDCPCPGTDFWEKTGLKQTNKVSSFFQYHKFADTDEAMATPTFGHYKQVDLN